MDGKHCDEYHTSLGRGKHMFLSRWDRLPTEREREAMQGTMTFYTDMHTDDECPFKDKKRLSVKSRPARIPFREP